MSILRADFFPKTSEEFKERTLGGAAISIGCIFFALLLFAAEFSSYRAIETTDRLAVDTSTPSDGKLDINLDIYFPSLPCAELVTDVVDESGSQQLAVTDTLHKLRVDRNGVPIDIPQPVHWGQEVAPAFGQRKTVALMEEARRHLADTLSHLDHEAEENPELSAAQHEAHRAELAEHAALINGRLSRLTAAAEEGQRDLEAHKAELAESADTLSAIAKQVESSAIFSRDERGHVLNNLHAMAKNVARLTNGTANDKTAANLHEALRIRLSILEDNIQGFVSAADIDRRDKYRDLETLLGDISNASSRLPKDNAEHVDASVAELTRALGTLASGSKGMTRKEAEAALEKQLAALHADLSGEPTLPDDYCGSCYGAGADPTACCNSCEDVRNAYRQKKWGFPGEANFEQCKREARLRAVTREEGEGCNLYGTMQVARVTGTLKIAPASEARSSRFGGAQLIPVQLTHTDVDHFNVTHQIKRFSFGTDFPGQTNPLDKVWTHSPSGAAVSRYFLKVVPTQYEFLSGKVVHTNQFSVTQYYKALDASQAAFLLPSLQFTYELTPLRVRKTEVRGGSLVGFFTRCAAVIGGLFSVAGMLDSAWYHGSKEMKKAREGRLD